MQIFQCCATPTMTKAHLYRVDTYPDNALTLCERAAVVVAYRGKLNPMICCKACMEKAFNELGHIPSAEEIGVREFTTV